MVQKLLGRMVNSETLLDPQRAESIITSLLADAEQVGDPDDAMEMARAEVAQAWGFREAEDRKPFIYNDGVAIIPIHGVLVNRFAYSFGWITGYNWIRAQRNAALEDPDVRLIAYDYNTPGGEAAGCDELAREMYEGRDAKPNIAIVDSLAASGGMWLATSNSRLVCAPSSSVGSIGVYILHMSFAGMLEQWGIDPTFIDRGKFKTSGNQFMALDKQGRQYLQTLVDERYDEFTAAVAEFRGIDLSVVTGTEARIMRPKEALDLGLIDEVKLPSKAVSDFLATLGEPEPELDDDEEAKMAEVSSEDRATIGGEVKTRIKGIMTSDEAKGRESLAEHLAFNTDMSVDDAVATLKASPKAATPEPAKDKAEDKGGDDKAKDKADDKDGDDKDKAKGGDDKDKAKGGDKSQFEQRMDADKHPEIGEDRTKGEGGGDDTQANVDFILGAQAQATGRDYRAKDKRAA
jgi:signal peptide peptidase SppA